MPTALTTWMQSIDASTTLRYSQYWKAITPTTDTDFFRRWLFAFMSVHTTWSNNVNGFNQLRALTWMDEREVLSHCLRRSGVGLHNNRTRYIWKFNEDFWRDPTFYFKHKQESWRRFRERLANKTLGLGLAKTTFAIELTYPEAPVCCLDRHLLRFMVGDIQLNGNMNPGQYAKLEARWVRAARKVDVPPVIARHIYWDQLQGQSDTRYWSSCLE